MDIQSCLSKPKGFSQKTVKRGQSPKQPDRACCKWADEKERRKRVPKAPKPHKGGKVRKQVTLPKSQANCKWTQLMGSEKQSHNMY